jgi:hypothetical protein
MEYGLAIVKPIAPQSKILEVIQDVYIHQTFGDSETHAQATIHARTT